MKSKWLVSAAVLLAVAMGAWWWLAGRAPHRNLVSTESARTSVTPPAVAATKAQANGDASLRLVANELCAAQTPEARRDALARLRLAVSTGSTNEISAAIRSLLDAQTDAGTGQGFKVGAGGALLEAPTLRTWLLDQLAQIDPAAAAAYAREILKSPSSPDEWAVALRNLARVDTSPEGAALLKEKIGELLHNTAWQQNPSVGYLEAFDVAVHLGGTSLMPSLSELVQLQDNQAVARAGFLALDRLVINQPAETLAALAEHPEWMTGREQTRANYFARADVGNARQRELVETYLLDATRRPAELQAFAGVFPNANFMISNNLLTSNTTLDHAALVQRDQTSLNAVNAWLADPRFASLRPLLLNMQTRLEGFLR